MKGNDIELKPKLLKTGDTIGVIAQSEPITEDIMEEIETSKNLLNELGINVKFSRHAFNNPTGYGETAKHKAEDINEMFADKEVKGILCAIGGYNSNSVFDYLDFEMIKDNPKIICGYSDPTSIINMIHEKTGLVTFHGPNFKTLSSIETDYGYKEFKKRFIEGDLRLGNEEDEYKTIKSGTAEGELLRRKFIAIF